MQENGSSCDKTAIESAKQRIATLRKLHSEDIITDDEYTARREQIINELTGTNSVPRQRESMVRPAAITSSKMYHNSSSRSPNTPNSPRVLNRSRIGSKAEHFEDSFVSSHLKDRQKNKSGMGMTQIKKHPPPDWSSPLYPTEKATKITYSLADRKWIREETMVKIEMKPFDKGGLRLVFHMLDLKSPDTPYVAKMSRDTRDDRNVYLEDVRMQGVAAHFAKKFNSYDPPKKIEFLPAYIMELKQREGSPVCGVERFITGHYQKYNNNRGWISEVERNTPLAFCHFTWEASQRKLLICDIQGVDDVYTDPQIHSNDGDGFGKGNLGQEGINKFLQTHQCNAICRFLGLENINKLPIANEGTVPASTVMIRPEITQLNGITLMRAPVEEAYRFPALRQKQSRFCGCTVL